MKRYFRKISIITIKINLIVDNVNHYAIIETGQAKENESEYKDN
jgi:hypothetical protein